MPIGIVNTMNKIKEFFKKLHRIWTMPERHAEQYNDMAQYVRDLHKMIQERTEVHADIGYKGTGSQIIVVGRYRGKDYVRSFNVRQDSLGSLIELLRNEEKYAGVGKFDMIGAMEFSAVYDRDRF